mgnify:CR=1 FL=1
MKRRVTKTHKSKDDILALCGPELFASVPKEQAIREIESAGRPYSLTSPYYTEYNGIRAAIVVIEDRFRSKYLRTDPDKTSKNNLLELPDC